MSVVTEDSTPGAAENSAPDGSLAPSSAGAGGLRQAFRDNPLREPWRTLFAVGLLFLVFFSVYFHIGLQLLAHDTLRDNLFFHSDIGRVVLDMGRFVANHDRTSVHPLFVLMTQPLTCVAKLLFGTIDRAAIGVNAVAGGACVVLTCLFFRAASVSLRRSILAALLLGLSASHLYFGSAPETFIWSVLGIILLFLGVVRAPGRWPFFLPAALVGFGALITNFATAMIAYAVSEMPVRTLRVWLRRVLLFGASLLLIAALLSVVQRSIWPSADFFFVPRSIEHERGFMPPNRRIMDLLQRDATLLRYIVVYDFFAPQTYLEREPGKRPALQLRSKSLSYLTRWGKLAVGLWLIALAAALWTTIRSKLATRPVILGLMLCTVWSFVLHTLYGDDLFLYSCNTCFSVLAWVVLCLSEWKQPRLVALIDGTLALIVLCAACNNYYFVKALVTMRLTHA